VNNIHNILCELGLSTINGVELVSNGVRDSDNINVLKCKNSGVIFLDKFEQGNINNYIKKNGFEYWSQAWSPENLASSNFEKDLPINEDDNRRALQFESYVLGKKWIDIGTGLGGVLRLLNKKCVCAHGVEPQPEPRKILQALGIKCHESLENLEDNYYDVATLFHVFEHFSSPIEELKKIRKSLKVGAKLIVEVPQANDALLTLYKVKAFKKFTFWSEHIILHTRVSLFEFLKAAGFINIKITGFQRYPLSNHLYWLLKGKPGGHGKWRFLLFSFPIIHLT